jgi:hypothetical protein
LRFDPPEEGVLPGETIVWTRPKGHSDRVIASGLGFFIVAPVILGNVYDLFGLVTEVIVGIVLLAILAVISAAFVQERRTRLYLTTERILEVRSGVVMRQISLDSFAGRSLSEFLESEETHIVDNRPLYTVRVHDPTSDYVFEIRKLDELSTNHFLRIGHSIECPYCGLDNSAISTRCKNCDAIL